MLRELRLEKGLTQERTAALLGISRRSLVRFEQNESLLSEQKLAFFRRLLDEYGLIDEEHGILTLEQIKQCCADVFKVFDVDFCYLFGSYAKGTATEKSDVDLLVSASVNGLQFYEIVECLREKLKKKVDLLDLAQLHENTALLQEVLKKGIKIYE